MIWGIRPEQVEDGEDATGSLFLLNIKCNIGPKPKGMKFTIGDGGKITWDDERVNMSMDDDGKAKTSRLNEAMDFLLEILPPKKAESRNSIFEQGAEREFNDKILYRAKDKIGGITVFRLGYGTDGVSMWRNDND